MRTKTRLFVAVTLAVLLPAAIALAKPGDGNSNGGKRGGGSNSSRGSNSSNSGNKNSGRSSQIKRDTGSNNSFKRNNDAPQRSSSQSQKKFSTPTTNPSGGQSKRSGSSAGTQKSNSQKNANDALKRYQQQGGTPTKNLGKSGDINRNNDALKRYQGKYQTKSGTPAGDLGKSGDTTRRYYRGSEPRKPGNNTGRDTAFMKENFPTQYKDFHKDSKGGYKKELTPRYRVNHDGLQQLNRNNSFVKKHDIDGKKFDNHWTHHNNNWHGAKHNWNGNHHQHWNNNWNNNWGNRYSSWYPWLGWGGWNRWGYGGLVGPAWNVGYYASPYYGYNYYYTGSAPLYTTNYQTAAAAPPQGTAAPPENVPDPSLAATDEPVTEQDAASAAAFADQGEIDFKAGNYHAAAKDWQHSLVDDSNNGAVMMLLGQALFAEGKYEESAGATQAAMQMLPEDKWGVVVSNYAQLYGNVQDYTDQLKRLEEARNANPESPALRFVLGFQFGYLNYPKQAVRELDQALTLAPRDLGSRKVRELFAAQWPEAPPLPAAVLEAEAAQPSATPAAPPTDPGALPAPSDAQPEDKIGTPS